MKKIVIYILFVFASFNISSAQLYEEWVRTYNPVYPGYNSADKSAVDKFGNLIIAGRSDSNSVSPDFIVLKYNAYGNLLWSRRYDGIAHDNDYFSDLILDDSGNVYITGKSYEGSSFGHINFVTIKYSANGEMRWKKSLDWTAHKEDVPFSITIDKQNNVYVAGYGKSSSQIYENFDMILVKYSREGEELWIRSFNSQYQVSDWGYSVVSDDSDFVYMSGYSILNSPVITTIKYDTHGNQIWKRHFPRLSSEFAIKLRSISDYESNIIINGYYNSVAVDFVTLKYDRNGNLLWSSIFDGPASNIDFCKALTSDRDLNIYVAGESDNFNGRDALIIKYSPEGKINWIRYFDNGLNQDDEIRAISLDNYQNVYAVGNTLIPATHNDFLILKYNLTGDLIWKKIFSKPFDNIAYSIAVDNYQNLFVSGYHEFLTDNSEIVILRYSQFTGTENENVFIKSRNSLNVSPNPFNPKTTINYIINEKSFIELKIFNITGQLIMTLISTIQEPSEYSLSFDGSNLSAGIYFCGLYEYGKLILIKKIMLIK